MSVSSVSSITQRLLRKSGSTGGCAPPSFHDLLHIYRVQNEMLAESRILRSSASNYRNPSHAIFDKTDSSGRSTFREMDDVHHASSFPILNVGEGFLHIPSAQNQHCTMRSPPNESNTPFFYEQFHLNVMENRYECPAFPFRSNLSFNEDRFADGQPVRAGENLPPQLFAGHSLLGKRARGCADFANVRDAATDASDRVVSRRRNL